MYWRQCTSFAAYRLSNTNGFNLPVGYGNAITWGSIARANGYRVDMNPAVGSIAWFSAGVNGHLITTNFRNPSDMSHVTCSIDTS